MAKADEAPRRGKPGPGRGHKWEPTEFQRGQATAYFGVGLSIDKVATLLQVHPDTVREHLEHERTFGTAQAEANLRSAIWTKALRGNVPCLIFLSKNLLGMANDPNAPQHNRELPPPPEPTDDQQDLCIIVRYVSSGHPQEFPAPPIELLPQQKLLPMQIPGEEGE